MKDSGYGNPVCSKFAYNNNSENIVFCGERKDIKDIDKRPKRVVRNGDDTSADRHRNDPFATS
jgi:hypothetical protein